MKKGAVVRCAVCLFFTIKDEKTQANEQNERRTFKPFHRCVIRYRDFHPRLEKISHCLLTTKH